MCSNNDVVQFDFVVLKLNGSDITSLSSYEAVQMFLQAKETLVVELCRKKGPLQPIEGEEQVSATCANLENCKLLNAKATCASTNIEDINTLLVEPPKSEVILSLRAKDVENCAISKGTQTMETFFDIKSTLNYSDRFIEQEHNLFEQCLEPEIDIEEVTLKRESVSEQLGLSVCCNFFLNSDSDDTVPVISKNNADSLSNEKDVCEDVFIIDVQADSIADRDGRLRRGDQILRINGLDVKSKKDTETQLLNTENNAVTLLVSRILYPEDDDDDDDEDVDDDIDSNLEYENTFLTENYTNVDKLDKVLLRGCHIIDPDKELLPSNNGSTTVKTFNSKTLTSETHAETSQAKTSRTLDSFGEKPATKNTNTSSLSKLLFDTNSDPEVNPKQLIVQVLPNTATDTHKSVIANANTKSKQYDYESEHIYETIPEDSESEPLYCSPYQSSNYMTAMGSCSSEDVLEMQQQSQRVAQWLGIKSQISPRSVHTLADRPSLYNRQNEILHRVFTLRPTVTKTNKSGSSSSGGCNENRNHNVNHLQDEVENSSSAYNTGGSNKSASPRQNALNINNEIVNNPVLKMAPTQTAKDTLVKSPINSMLMLPFGKGSIPVGANNGFALVRPEMKLMRKKSIEEQQNQCPQFNAPNLSRYHFVSSQEVANKSVTEPKENSTFPSTNRVPEEIPMVWKVKRRPDGTRYIVKRPVRNHVQLGIRKTMRNNEITTTEDDTISEVKIGRYWTKEERKRHIERARERRHHQQQQLLHQQPQYPT